MLHKHGIYGGTQIFVSTHATEERPLFPDKKWTKRRRRRVIGKYGSWSRHFPCAFRCGPALYVHPAIYKEMKRHTTPTPAQSADR